MAALGLLWASAPAQAHCFTRWYYPWKQHCGVAHAQRIALAAAAIAADLDEDALRANAIEKLKLILGEIQ